MVLDTVFPVSHSLHPVQEILSGLPSPNEEWNYPNDTPRARFIFCPSWKTKTPFPWPSISLPSFHYLWTPTSPP